MMLHTSNGWFIQPLTIFDFDIFRVELDHAPDNAPLPRRAFSRDQLHCIKPSRQQSCHALTTHRQPHAVRNDSGSTNTIPNNTPSYTSLSPFYALLYLPTIPPPPPPPPHHHHLTTRLINASPNMCSFCKFLPDVLLLIIPSISARSHTLHNTACNIYGKEGVRATVTTFRSCDGAYGFIITTCHTLSRQPSHRQPPLRRSTVSQHHPSKSQDETVYSKLQHATQSNVFSRILTDRLISVFCL
mgnify:CR=1 FL=1